MKQRWLFETPPANESTLTRELDSTTRVGLINLMAMVIESVHRQQNNLLQQSKEAFDERTTNAS